VGAIANRPLARCGVSGDGAGPRGVISEEKLQGGTGGVAGSASNCVVREVNEARKWLL